MGNTPNIRFKGFDEDWEQRKLGNLTTYRNGTGHEEKQSDVGKYELVNLNSISIDGGLKPSGKFIDEETETLIKDDLVMVLSDVGHGDLLGRVAIIPENNRFVLNQRVALLRNNGFADTKYLFSYINAHQRYFKLQGAGSSQLNISRGSVENFEVLLPKRDEQKQIGECFSNLDHLITLHQRKCQETKKLKEYMLQKMFPKKGEKIPEIRFEGFTGDWEQRKLGELSSSFEYGLNAAAKAYDGENKYIRITDIDDDSREFKQEDITSPDTDLSSAENYKLSEGDILFARTGASVGKSYIYKASDGLVYYAGFLIRASIKPEYNSEFVFQNTLTGNYEKFIKVTSMRSGQPGVNAQEYSQYQIMMPSKPEQDKIGDCLRNLDNLITLHQCKVRELTELKNYMLQNMFPKKGGKKCQN